MTYFRDNIDAMDAYVPGAQLLGVTKLNTNENPYPPSPAVTAAMAEFDPQSLRVYPDPMAGAFRTAVAELLDFPEEWILPGNGSDNIIVMLARAIGGPIVAADPTFPYYQTQAQVEGAAYIPVPYEQADRGEFVFPLDGLIDTPGALTFVANPDSPLGSIVDNDTLRQLAKARLGNGILVIDEAYADFAGKNALDLAREFENVIIIRTLSKSYSLAGLRLGYAVARPELLENLAKAKEVYNIPSITEAAGAAALGDQAYMLGNVEKIVASRNALAAALTALGWTVCDSHTNFLLAGPADGDAKGVFEKLQAGGIFVRYFSHPQLADTLRITVGTDEQNQRLLELI